MNALDQKINTHFPGLVVRKDLVKAVKGNAIVPSYVLEYLLGQYCATDDEADHPGRHRDGQGDPRQALRPPQRGRTGPVERSARRAATRSSTRSASTSTTRTTSTRPSSPTSASRRCSSTPTRSKRTPSCSSAASGASATSSTSPQRRQARQPVDLGSTQADPALPLRLRRLPRGARASSPPTSGSTC